jgi:hypothetical protein
VHRKDRKTKKMKSHHVPISQSVDGIELGKGKEGGLIPESLRIDDGILVTPLDCLLRICFASVMPWWTCSSVVNSLHKCTCMPVQCTCSVFVILKSLIAEHSCTNVKFAVLP